MAKSIDEFYKLIDAQAYLEAYDFIKLAIKEEQSKVVLSDYYYALGTLIDAYCPDLVENEFLFSLTAFKTAIEYNQDNLYAHLYICESYSDSMPGHFDNEAFINSYHYLISKENKLNENELIRLKEKKKIYDKN